MSDVQPRGVRRREVERVEVVVDGLDLGPVDDVEAEPDEHVLDLALSLRHQVQAADRRERVGRQRDVDPVLLQAVAQLGRREMAARCFDQPLELLPDLVCGLTGGGPLLGRQLGDVAQQVRELRLAPEVADPDLLERRVSSAAAIAASASCLIWAIRSVISCRRHPSRLVEGDRGRHRGVQGMRVDGDVGGVVGRLDELSR